MWAYNRRATEMDSTLCRTCLFLHPVYRNVADINTDAYIAVLKQVRCCCLLTSLVLALLPQ